MSLTFIDPLSENFAYLWAVIYCSSPAQLVFNTLPGNSNSSSLSAKGPGATGMIFHRAQESPGPWGWSGDGGAISLPSGCLVPSVLGQ